MNMNVEDAARRPTRQTAPQNGNDLAMKIAIMANSKANSDTDTKQASPRRNHAAPLAFAAITELSCTRCQKSESLADFFVSGNSFRMLCVAGTKSRNFK